MNARSIFADSVIESQGGQYGIELSPDEYTVYPRARRDQSRIVLMKQRAATVIGTITRVVNRLKSGSLVPIYARGVPLMLLSKSSVGKATYSS